MSRMRTRSAVAAVAIGAAVLTGAGFGIASAMTPAAPPAATQHQSPANGADKPEAGDTPDAPGQN
ncbi:MAG: hypothetical protein INR66_12510 [Gordonia polyisoprenivorans]|nr:hypothetical protein [Gordonia polyisoprenivorans]